MTKRAGKTTGKKIKALRQPTPDGAHLVRDDAGDQELYKDSRLLEVAVRQRWPSNQQLRQAIRQKVQRRALETENDKTLAALARVDVAMEGQNQTDQLGQVIAPAQAQQVNIYLPDNKRLMPPKKKRKHPPEKNGSNGRNGEENRS